MPSQFLSVPPYVGPWLFRWCAHLQTKACASFLSHAAMRFLRSLLSSLDLLVLFHVLATVSGLPATSGILNFSVIYFLLLKFETEFLLLKFETL